MSAKEVATAIGVPIHGPGEDWEGNCHGIALAMLEAGLVPDGKLQYGLWWGRIAPGSVFEGRPFTHHGWIKRADGTIVDPTRWVFEGAEPYVWEGRNSGEYDFGGNRLKSMTIGQPPAYAPGRDVSLVLCTDTQGFVRTLLNNSDDRLSVPQVFWLANLPLGSLDESATRELYEALVRADLEGLIPIDNRIEVLGR